MYNGILVALDGSELAETVLPHAEALAEKFGSTVTLLRVTTPASAVIAPATAVGVPMGAFPGIGYVPPDLTGDLSAALQAERDEAANYLKGVAERLAARGIQVRTETPEGDAGPVILERAQELGVELIVMTTHGRTGLARFFLGSVADEVVRRARCPILLVRVLEPEAQEGQT